MIRRLIFPLVLAILAIGLFMQSKAADKDADRPALVASEPAPSRLSTPLLSARRLPEQLQTPEANRRLVASLDEIVGGLPEQSCFTVVEGGEIRYEHRSSSALIPASTQKLITAVAALEEFGTDYTFKTQVFAQSESSDGVIDGNVWLVGGGDPLLMTSDYAERYLDVFPYTDLEDLAEQLIEGGINTITGAVIGDETYFNQIRWVESWPERFRAGAQNQTGPLSALSVNDGFVNWDAENTANSLNIPAAEPAQFAAALFDDLLEERAVRIFQSAYADELPIDAIIKLGEVESPPVSELVKQMLQTSDNTTAEILVKALGAHSGSDGSTNSGRQVIEEIVASLATDASSLAVFDGSGLDPANRVSCSTLVELLQDEKFSSDLRTGLAVAGESGTLRNRLVGSSAEGRLFGKTGTLNDVKSLAGIVYTLEDRTLTFALISNADPMPSDVLEVHDQLILDLVAYPTGPPLSLLVPIPVVVTN
ncbi:MAG: D-alanyl-D-alanine carboxypeptidase [Acidimicrobiales bacterium AG-410-I20]|nr:MAG: D-alanyl-D-alanine carboxypeptidase [Acidimicrobiales bacterium AG-410-I20]